MKSSKKVTACMLSLIISISPIVSLKVMVNGAGHSVATSQQLVVSDINGVERAASYEVNPVEDFNFVLPELTLAFRGNVAKLSTVLNGSLVEFNATLNNSQLGFNADNRVFGVSGGQSGGFQLTRFVIEQDSGAFFLVEPNLNLIGRTVVTIVLLDTENDIDYFFQFPADELGLPNIPTARIVTNGLIDLELANIAAEPLSVVSESIVIEGIDITPGGSVVNFEANDGNDNQISPAMFGGSLLHSSRTFGWTHQWLGWKNEGPNSQRNIGYSIYHMPDNWSGNTMNYVVQYEGLVNFNWDSQQFVSTFMMTHNVWIEFLSHINTTYIFEDKARNARLSIDAEIFVRSLRSGSFTHFMIPNVSSTGIQTGVWHPVDHLTVQVDASIYGLRHSGDHITVTGLGSGIDSFSGAPSRVTLWVN